MLCLAGTSLLDRPAALLLGVRCSSLSTCGPQLATIYTLVAKTAATGLDAQQAGRRCHEAICLRCMSGSSSSLLFLVSMQPILAGQLHPDLLAAWRQVTAVRAGWSAPGACSAPPVAPQCMCSFR